MSQSVNLAENLEPEIVDHKALRNTKHYNFSGGKTMMLGPKNKLVGSHHEAIKINVFRPM
jgi:hypothetical protein